MFAEYVGVLNGVFQEIWSEDIGPFLNLIRHSHFFWPGVVLASLVLIILTRKITR